MCVYYFVCNGAHVFVIDAQGMMVCICMCDALQKNVGFPEYTFFQEIGRTGPAYYPKSQITVTFHDTLEIWTVQLISELP